MHTHTDDGQKSISLDLPSILGWSNRKIFNYEDLMLRSRQMNVQEVRHKRKPEFTKKKKHLLPNCPVNLKLTQTKLEHNGSGRRSKE